MPELNLDALKKVGLAGVIGEVAFEVYAWMISPVIFGPTLEPANLVKAIVAKLTGIMLPYGAAFVLHFLIGSVLFAGMVFAIQGIIKKGYVLAGLISGLILWFVAQGMLAPFIGRPFMMNFNAYTQSSFVAHTSMM
ncbi:MAG: hypothetical protein ABJO45_12655, partial [Lentilitoribacter sp.]